MKVLILFFLKEFAKGVNPSHSMPTNSLHAHYNRITKSEYTIEPLIRVKKNTSFSPKKQVQPAMFELKQKVKVTSTTNI